MLQILTKQLKKKSRDLTEEFDEDHALDMVMNAMVEDLDFEEEVQPEGITEEELQKIINDSGIKEAIDNIQSDFKEAVEDFKDLDVALMDGLENLENDFQEEEPKQVKQKSFKFPFKKAKAQGKAQGLVDQNIEQRTIKQDGVGNQGPLYYYRTNKPKK